MIAVVCGIGLMISPFALSLFDRAPAGERIVDRFRTTMSHGGLRELRSNFATVGALADQFVNQTGPGLAQALHMSTAEYNAFVAREFPKVQPGVKEIPPLVALEPRRGPPGASSSAVRGGGLAALPRPLAGDGALDPAWIGAGLTGLGLVLAFTAFYLRR